MRIVLFFVAAFLLPAAPPSAKVDFNREIRPILSDRCFSCHGPDEASRKANLRLDTKAGAFERKGVVVAGDAEASRLLKRIAAQNPASRMPPTGPPMTAQQLDVVKRWISEGAQWTEHWSYATPQRPAEPAVRTPAWAKTPIDRFVLARLDKEGLKPAAEAERANLLRRVSFDLTGLPPTPEEVKAFLADKTANAYEKQVDRLLGSPRYGERMALQWLDIARYADTHGYHIDSHRDMWRWREWVIRAFQDNKPFNQFVVEQIAGDMIPGASKDQILASGFNRNHMINFEGGAIPEEYQNEYMVDRVETTAMAFMAMTLGCAKCHDHKYDPLSQKDFYRFGAFFNNINEKGLDGQKGNAAPLLELPSDRQEARSKAIKERIPELEKELQAKQVTEWYEAWKKQPHFTAASREGLLAHYEFDGSLADSSGRYQHGKSLRDEGSYPIASTGDRALELNGRSEVELAALPFAKTTALWFQNRARTFHNGILARMDAERRGWELFMDDPYAIPRMRQQADLVLRRVERWPDRVWEARLEEHMLIRRPTWWHIAWVGDALYINGEPRKYKVTRNTLTKPFEEAAGPITIGGRVPADRLRGRIDDLRLYDRALSAAEIRALAIDTPFAVNLALPKLAKEHDDDLREYFLAHDAATKARHTELLALQKEKDDLEWAIPSVMVMKEMEKPRDTYLLGRGDYQNHLEKVTPGVPASLPPLPKDAPANRLTLAQWLTDPNHPLTARVAVNRFWQNYFATGLVKTSEDFGSQGEPPVHPELLDWLATEFVRSGWDVKALQRLIVTSATYRQSSKITPLLKERDPENRLLARGPRHRLTAEMVRDNALAVSGLLDGRIGGESVLPYQPAGIWEELAFGAEFSAQAYQQSHGADLYRRSMYTFWKRTAPPASLNIFDAPDREKCQARRPVTNTPLQALALWNDPTYVEAARALAQRVLLEAGPAPSKRVERAFELALARKPQGQELPVLLALAKQKLADYRSDPQAAEALLGVGESKPDQRVDKAELAAWTTAMSVLLNLDETISKE